MKKFEIAATVLIVIVRLYLGAFFTAPYWYPNSNDGPGENFDAAFGALNEITVEEPDYLQDAKANRGVVEV